MTAVKQAAQDHASPAGVGGTLSRTVNFGGCKVLVSARQHRAGQPCDWRTSDSTPIELSAFVEAPGRKEWWLLHGAGGCEEPGCWFAVSATK